jgi:hypothetical protein
LGNKISFCLVLLRLNHYILRVKISLMDKLIIVINEKIEFFALFQTEEREKSQHIYEFKYLYYILNY